MGQFGKDLVESAREALAIAVGDVPPPRVTVPDTVDVAAIRERTGLSQGQFANSFGLAVSAVRDWEQMRRAPDRTARVLLTVIDKNPEAIVDALAERG